jgi:hypothetical protein
MKAQTLDRYIKLALMIVLMPLLLLFFSPGAEGQTDRLRRVPDGVWGGEHMGLWVEKERARIEYDCGRGRIDEPLVLDRRGRFNVRGTHYKEHGGPVRIDEQKAGQPARYTGKLVAQTLTITVTLMDTQKPIGTFRLTHNEEPRIVKCLRPH